MYKPLKLTKKWFVFYIVILLSLPSVLPCFGEVNTIYGDQMVFPTDSPLDVQYIYNLTKSLSYVIFKAYNESNGDIAKGRAYGSKGEHMALDILYENLTKLGLYTYKEKVVNTEEYPKLTEQLEVLDYGLKVNGKKIDCYISPVFYKNKENNFDYNFTYNYTNLKVISQPLFPNVYKIKNLISKKQPFVIIVKNRNFYSNYRLVKLFPFIENFDIQYLIIRKLQAGIPLLQSWRWNNYLDYCKGVLLYDFNKDTHDMNYLVGNNHIPFININGSDGKYILDNIDDVTVDFKLKQQYNTSVVSYNVIGQLNGTDPSKTIILNGFYDSWWCQGTADSAIGMSIVLAIAKYFKENNITPKYNIKFIGFSGEENGGCAGAFSYESVHHDENIPYVLDLNQLGFDQGEPKLTLDIFGNNRNFLNEIYKVAEKTDYENRVDSSKGLKKVFLKEGGPSNAQAFAKGRTDCNTAVFIKVTSWKYHHRDGVNHKEGDVLKYFDPIDVAVTGELILNITKYLTLDNILDFN